MEEFANPQRAGAAHRLEGSRFSSRQLYNLAASGSREWPIAMQFYRSACIAPSQQNCWVKALRWVIPGSRLLAMG
jgi:hypothetical protein